MAVAAVVFVTFEFGPSLAGTCPIGLGLKFSVLCLRIQGPERTSNLIEDSASKGNHAYPCMAQKKAAIPTMDHN